MSELQQFLLPDLSALCPLTGSSNPYYKEAGSESSAWINSYNIFTDRKRAFFVQGCNELLVSHTYPYAGYEQFRTVRFLLSIIILSHLTIWLSGVRFCKHTVSLP